jgi:hypothetical protein
MSLLQFVASRIERGRMESAALGRANRAIRTLPTSDRQRIAGTKWHIPAPGLQLSTEPVPWNVAQTFVNVVHRHHSAPVGHIFSIGVYAGEDLVGVAVCGRPVARMLDDGKTLEVTRVASVGYRNAVSKLLSAVRKEAAKRSFTRVITYTLASLDSGSSLKASGFTACGASAGGQWSRVGRTRSDTHPTGKKQRWEVALSSRPTPLRGTKFGGQT